jgi:signal peptidase II
LKVLFITLSIVILDQASKIIVKGFSIPFLNFQHKGMHHGQKIPVIDDFFSLTFVENPGIAFGFDPAGCGRDFNLAIIASATFFFSLFKKTGAGFKNSPCFIPGGASVI